MFFLFQRINQLRDLAQGDLFDARSCPISCSTRIRIFAQLTLGDDELNLYRQLYDQLRPQAPTPDLVIYLQADPETLLTRVKKRGVAMEAAHLRNLSVPAVRKLQPLLSSLRCGAAA